MMLALSAGHFPSEIPNTYEQTIQLDKGWIDAIDSLL